MVQARTAVVVGAGIFGCAIAAALVDAGWSVRVFDDARPLSGSGPSGGLMKPSWFSSLGPGVHKPALELLDRLFGLQQLDMLVPPTGFKTNVKWIPYSKMRATTKVEALSVSSVSPGLVRLIGGAELEPELIVVAAGFWSNQLVQVPKLEGKAGVSFRWQGAQLRKGDGFIRPWAPYKQLVAFNEGPNVWGGDGSAIKPENWNEEREDQSAKRVATATSLPMTMALRYRGIRPYVPGAKPCLVEEIQPGLWVATGGAKNGMIAAGWAAHEIVRRTS